VENPLIKKYGIDFLDNMLDEQDLFNHLKEKIDKSFLYTQKKKVMNHPTKPGVKAVKTWFILPHFAQIDKKYIHLVNSEDQANVVKNCLVPGN